MDGMKSQIQHLCDLSCALDVIAGEAVTVLESDNAPLAAALRGASDAICNHAESIQRELAKMQANPQWRAAG